MKSFAVKKWMVVLATSLVSIEVLSYFDPLMLQASDSATIAWHQVAAPSDNVLLIGGDEGTCAIRFTSLRAVSVAKASTTFNSGEETYWADYEWSFTDRRSNTDTLRGTGRATKGALWGIGRFAFGGGSPHVRCGPMKAAWLPRGSVSFSDKVACKYASYRLAPTRWKSLSEVKLDDPTIRWFECDEHRKTFYISSGDL